MSVPYYKRLIYGFTIASFGIFLFSFRVFVESVLLGLSDSVNALYSNAYFVLLIIIIFVYGVYRVSITFLTYQDGGIAVEDSISTEVRSFVNKQVVLSLILLAAGVLLVYFARELLNVRGNLQSAVQTNYIIYGLLFSSMLMFSYSISSFAISFSVKFKFGSDEIADIFYKSVGVALKSHPMITVALPGALEKTLSPDRVEGVEGKDCGLLGVSGEIERAYQLISQTLERNSLFVSTLKRQGDYNLTIGLTLSVLGFLSLVALLYNVFISASAASEGETIFIYRALLSLFVQLFAFFFLRLYRQSIHDIKYYQNEMTNAEMQRVSLVTSLAVGDKKTTASVILALSNVERNFKLAKGESTVYTENHRIDSTTEDSIPRLITSSLSRLNKRKS